MTLWEWVQREEGWFAASSGLLSSPAWSLRTMGGCLPEFVTSENAVPKPRPFVLLCKACLVSLKLWVIYLNAGRCVFWHIYPGAFGKGARDEEAVTAPEKLKLSLKMRGSHGHWWTMGSVLPFLTWGRPAASCRSCQAAPHVHEYRMGPWSCGGSGWVLLHLNLQQLADGCDTSSPQCFLYLLALRKKSELTFKRAAQRTSNCSQLVAHII